MLDLLVWLLLLTQSVVTVLASTSPKPIRKPGYCSLYDSCGKKSVFGKPLPCSNNTRAVDPLEESVEILTRICGTEFPIDDGVCCSYNQLQTLEENLKKVEPLISSCPACKKNFYDFFCRFTCSPDQSTFVEVTKISNAIDTGKEVVSELTVYTDPEYASKFFDSCKELKFSATNGYAMDLIGGGAKNYSLFLKFLGDEKPLLGGSPFQINYKYELPHDSKLDLKLTTGDMKACNDTLYKCACSDCSVSCPTLPKYKDFRLECYVGIMPCFSFAVMMVWITLFLIIGGYHIYLARVRRLEFERLNSILEGDFIGDDIDEDNGMEDEQNVVECFISPHMDDQYRLTAAWLRFRDWLMSSIEVSFARLALTCAKSPYWTIAISLILSLLCCTGLTKLEWETNPINLWVSPNEKALHERQYFESNFGEWFRIEQLIISNKDNSPVLSWETVQWWFEKELELQELQDEFNNTQYLDPLCFKPLEDTCAIESFTQYFQGDIRYLNEYNWASEINACAESPVNCLPSFQQPLKKNLLFSLENVLESEAFVITLLINSNLTNEDYTNKATDYERALQRWVKKLQEEKQGLQISYSTEVSLLEELNQSSNTDVKIVVISYLFMFLYASIALGGKIPSSFSLKSFVLTRFLLGLSGIIIILLSVAASAGICSFIGIKSTLIIAEVIPFLVLAIGVDNIFLIVHELHVIGERFPEAGVESRISLALEKIGPSCFISAILQVLMFLVASSVQMPAVKNFAFYSAGAVAINFILQMTTFISLLSLDQKRLEEGRLDIAPWIQVNKIQVGEGAETVEHIEYNFSHFVSRYYAPWLLTPSNRGKIFSVFLLWLGISLSLFPRIQLGLDQRMALPSDSYLVQYFDAVYDYLSVGPPVFFVVKDLDVTHRESQQTVCGKFSTCNEFSIANILEQEYKRGDLSTIAEPTSNWLDDFLTWLNPELDQCCRFKKSALGEEFCSPFAPPRQCQSCYADHSPPYNISMEGLPEGEEFMMYFRQWITEPSDPCPLGGKAPYSSSINYNASSIKSSYFRTSHQPLRSQLDFIVAYKNALRVVSEMKDFADNKLDAFAFSPFYIFFVQYIDIITLTFTTLTVASVIIWSVSAVLLGLPRMSTILTLTVLAILVNIGGVMAVWGISLNAVSLVNLIICLGLAVEFTVHITRAYLTASEEENEEDLYNSFMNMQDGPKYLLDNLKCLLAFKALTRVGGSVLGGITLTKFIGIAVLAFTRSQIFEVYYFRMWLSLVVIASTHALILMPVLLSMFGEDN